MQSRCNLHGLGTLVSISFPARTVEYSMSKEKSDLSEEELCHSFIVIKGLLNVDCAEH